MHNNHNVVTHNSLQHNHSTITHNNFKDNLSIMHNLSIIIHNHSIMRDPSIIHLVKDQGNKGCYRGGVCEGSGFGGGRGLVVCHNCHKLRHYARDFPLPPTTCMYCHAVDHETNII
jgi:hypothetical protein